MFALHVNDERTQISKSNQSAHRLEEELRSARQDAHEAREKIKELLERHAETKRELREMSKELRQVCACGRVCVYVTTHTHTNTHMLLPPLLF